MIKRCCDCGTINPSEFNHCWKCWGYLYNPDNKKELEYEMKLFANRNKLL